MSERRPRISVIIAVYNGAASLQRCIDSYARQTYPDKELIVIDGGSTDGTVEMIKANADKIAYWESEADRGIYHAWNKGLDHITGDWVCFIGSDDVYWQDDAFERLASTLSTAYPPIRVAYASAAVLDGSDNVVRYNGRPWEEVCDGFRYTLTIPHGGTMHHRSLFDAHGRFDESFRIAGDYDLLLRELKNGSALFVPDVVMVGFRHGGLSNSPRAMSTMLDELRRIYRKHGITHPWTRRYSKVSFKIAACAWTVRIFGDSGFRTAADLLRRVAGKPAIWRQ